MSETAKPAGTMFRVGDRVRARGSLQVLTVTDIIFSDSSLGPWIVCDRGGGREIMLELVE